MSLADIMDLAPIWGLFAITGVLVFLSIEIGYWLGRYRRRNYQGERESPVGAIVGASLGLLGFVLAFTFGLAASRSIPKTDGRRGGQRHRNHVLAPASYPITVN
ncbi:MAG: hypothetical protein U1D30_15625 [Planctomycetota bacterium]